MLKSGGRSSLPGEAGKRVQGVGAPFQLQLENERRLQSSAGGCLRAGMSLRQYMVVRCFLYNKILKAEQLQRWFSLDLGFHLKSWCSCVMLCVMVYSVLTAHVYCLLNI